MNLEQLDKEQLMVNFYENNQDAKNMLLFKGLKQIIKEKNRERWFSLLTLRFKKYRSAWAVSSGAKIYYEYLLKKERMEL